MTKEERHLWYDFLKGLCVTVRRQHIIGPYIADFYCAEAALVIEIDGSQHYEEEHTKKDQIRDAYFRSCGLRVKRYSNLDINTQFSGVCEDLYEAIYNGKKPSP